MMGVAPNAQMHMRRMPRVQALFKEFRPVGTALTSQVLCTLAEHDPLIRSLIPEDAESLCRRLFATFDQIISRADRFHLLEAPLADLGRRAMALGLDGIRLCRVRNEILRVVREIAGDEWTEQDHADLRTLLDAVVGAMVAGAERRRAA
jgi:hypothetical protein